MEQVLVNDPGDATNLALIRSHLAKEAALFRSGNYSDPAKIHGMDMPGLKELEAGAARVTVVYDDLPGGAQITYSSAEPALVSAIHSWFDRQVADHGARNGWRSLVMQGDPASESDARRIVYHS